MPTIPSGAENEVAFISGITNTGKLAATAFGTWKGDSPAHYNPTNSYEVKWGSTTPGTSGGTVTYWFDTASNWTSAERSALTAGLALWADEANITFSLASSAASANQIFYRGAVGSKNAYEQFTSATYSTVGSSADGHAISSKIVIDTSQAFWHVGTSFDDAGGYGWQTVVHEEGHMLGLGHGGPYNGNVTEATQQFSNYDTRLWTLMSYIDPWTTSAKYYSTYPVTGTSWGTNSQGWYYEPTTPMILDILAVQRVYGAPTSGPLTSGGQIFGFHSNVAGAAGQFFDFTVNQHPVITIWDGGTNNTLDLSGFSAKSTINLNPGTFSSANGMINNIAIAQDTIIENAIGGPGDDVFTGSAANNTFTGNGGNDTIDGGAGTDTAVFHGLRSTYTITTISGNSVRVSGADGTDTLTNVERLAFNDQTVTLTTSADDYANSLSDTAHPFGRVTVNGSSTGSLESTADRDWFSVQLVAGTTYTINLTGSQGGGGTLSDPYLYLHNSTGTVVASNDDIVLNTNRDSQVTYVAVSSGTYYVEAAAYNDLYTGTYRITVTGPNTPTDDYANSLTDTSHPFGSIAVNGSSAGTLETAGDHDWFSVQLVGGATYTISLTGSQGGGGTLSDPHLYLHNSTGTVVGDNDDIVLNVNLDSQLTFSALSSGTYYVDAGAYNDSYTGSYTVRVTANAPADDFANSFTDQTHPFGHVAINGSSTGTLETTGDRDWFSVQLTAGTTYVINLTGSHGAGGTLSDPYLYLHDSTGALLDYNDDIILNTNPDSQLTFSATTTGTYYLEAGAYHDNYSGTYTVSVRGTTTVDDFANSLTDTAHPFGHVAVNGASVGTLEVAGDRDWFSVQLSAGTTYVIGLQGVTAGAGTLADPYLYLHNSTGAVVAENDDITYGVNVDSQLTFTASTTGTYYLEAGAYNDSYAGTYMVSVSASGSPSNLIDDAITELYVGYYNRAPDPGGETYWVGRLHGGMSLGQIAQSYSVQTESTNLYPFLASPNTASTAMVQAFVESIYGNLFNRQPDPGGEAYWVNNLQTGASTVGGAIINIISGAQGTDLLTVNNKVTVGNYYDNAVFNNHVQVTAASATSALSGVTYLASSVTAAEAYVDAYVLTAPPASLVPSVGLVGVVDASTGQHLPQGIDFV